MRCLSIVVMGIYFLLSTSCSSFSRSMRKPERSGQLAQRAIFEYLQRPNVFLAGLTNKGLPKIDPLLCTRGKLNVNGKEYFKKPMYVEAISYPLSRKTYRLTIPDSLAGQYRYTSDDIDYEHDYAVIHQFSPLLPAREPNIYLMEHYTWASNCDEEGCVRFLDRDCLKFKIEDQKITYLDGVRLYNQTDFIGFGSFSRKKMEEALEGEKIIRYGW